MELTAANAKKILAANALNLARKVANGETLTPKEVAILESVAEGGAAEGERFAASQDELGKALGVDRKTIQRWLKKPGHPETAADGRYDVIAWRAFANVHGRKADYGDEDPDMVRERAKSVLLQNQKLEFQIKVLKKEYVSSVDVEQWGAHLGGEIRKTVVSIHKIASSLAGLPTAEIEIRLRELENEILMKLHLLASKTAEMKEAADEK